MGSCGHFYVVEHLVPFKLKSYYTSLRAKILVHLMGTLKLFYEFLNEPLHWCDVKFDNFGLSAGIVLPSGRSSCGGERRSVFRSIS